jgi:hypothetical protein
MDGGTASGSIASRSGEQTDGGNAVVEERDDAIDGELHS